MGGVDFMGIYMLCSFKCIEIEFLVCQAEYYDNVE